MTGNPPPDNALTPIGTGMDVPKDHWNPDKLVDPPENLTELRYGVGPLFEVFEKTMQSVLASFHVLIFMGRIMGAGLAETDLAFRELMTARFEQ